MCDIGWRSTREREDSEKVAAMILLKKLKKKIQLQTELVPVKVVGTSQTVDVGGKEGASERVDRVSQESGVRKD